MTAARPLRPNDPGEVGGFRLTARIGEGAQGVVYLGEDGAGRRVAVKLLHADFTTDPRARTAFERELAAARRVAPFCTAPIIAADAEADPPYTVSEYVEGPSLRTLVTERGPLTGGELTRLAIGTATALAAIHEAGVVHRDFKPANVLLGEDGPKVIDFGIARSLDATSATLTGAVGTPAFMAPEQVEGTAGGAPLDMFAWGCTMAFAANGVPPFGGDSVPAIMRRVLHEEPDLGALAGELRELVAACLAKEPRSRPTAVEVLRRLLGAEAGANLLAEGSFAAAPLTLASPRLPPGGLDPRRPSARRRSRDPDVAAGAVPRSGFRRRPALGRPRRSPTRTAAARVSGGSARLRAGGGRSCSRAALAMVLLTAAGIAARSSLRDGDRAGGEQPVAGSSPTASSAASPAAAARGCSYESTGEGKDVGLPTDRPPSLRPPSRRTAAP